jgi:hypothetical protein
LNECPALSKDGTYSIPVAAANAIVSNNGLGYVLVFLEHRFEHCYCPVSRKPFLIVVGIKRISRTTISTIFLSKENILFLPSLRREIHKRLPIEIGQKKP